MRIALVNMKGGAAKTTTGVHLAGALAARRGAGRVVLIDGDVQHAAGKWAARGDGLPFEVIPTGVRIGEAEHVVIDTAANEAEADLVRLAAGVDRVLIPTPPYALDLMATLDTLRVLRPAADVRVLLTKCPPAPQRDAIEARTMLEARGVNVLRAEVPMRKAHTMAVLAGVLLRDLHDRDAAALWALWPKLAREVIA